MHVNSLIENGNKIYPCNTCLDRAPNNALQRDRKELLHKEGHIQFRSRKTFSLARDMFRVVSDNYDHTRTFPLWKINEHTLENLMNLELLELQYTSKILNIKKNIAFQFSDF